MKYSVIIATVVIIAFVALASGIAFSGLLTQDSVSAIDSVTIATDKDTYHSKDVMKITIGITASGHIKNVLLKVEGITDRYGRMRLSEGRVVDLTAGPNTITVGYTLPVCSVCAGLSPGTYGINASLIKDNVTLSTATHSISIG
jgi:hypothetical protein